MGQKLTLLAMKYSTQFHASPIMAFLASGIFLMDHIFLPSLLLFNIFFTVKKEEGKMKNCSRFSTHREKDELKFLRPEWQF